LQDFVNAHARAYQEKIDYSDEVDKNVRNEVLSTLSGTTKISKCTITYVAGFVARKSLKLMGNCRICSNILLFSDGSQINDDFVSARQYSNTSTG
jgi:hypothetical protein